MEASILNTKYEDSDKKTLKGLFEAFGSLFSLQDIASAYYKANQNADLAGEILYDMQEIQECTSTTAVVASNRGARSVKSSKSCYDTISEKPCCTNRKFRASKQIWRPLSGGTIPSILGKESVNSTLVANSSCMETKPMKLDAKELPMSELWGEETKLNPSKKDHMYKDIGDFLFRMLGDGFQLERDEIRQVLDKCGYDVQKSMEKLLDLSAETLDEANKSLGKSTEKNVDVHSNSDEHSYQNKVPPMNFSHEGDANGISNINEGGLPGQEERNDIQKEVFVALFNVADRSEGLSRRVARTARRPRVLGELVVEPPKDFTLEHKPDSVVSKQDNGNDDDEEDSYQKLRRAVKEYRVTMKEYYKAAVNAFAKGDYDRANKLMDEGHFFHEKARKADEESSQKIFEMKNVDTNDVLTLDLHDHGAKEAMRLLKRHLASLSGISSIKYLKVVIETNEEDTSKGARRRLVMKLLEKESIKWTEGGDAGTILIRLDKINPKCLSFAKRYYAA
ncbi:putative nuclear RNA export factor SDE5 isoform X1 [Hevea brasiliensis]|uniref:putative nuclear RNA export factor SDE5 isoform X1 n=1 Tax=Hevea brasiliensis TaxID=3981 RepID=UPI0025F8F55B|nr:putative nuclear RNA export factor SDE5 isoform X1 [Hevea brasiliensis]XP_057986284.1 putative nuclear RNA export factor SDE5 isoform X1 [Hevea brasiliensis]